MRKLLADSEMIQAFLASNTEYEGVFFVAVKTTGIFCKPTCKARKPLVKNILFFPTTSDALHAGFRACLRCKPMHPVGKIPEIADTLKSLVEEKPSQKITEQDLRDLGIDPSTARRQFQRIFGMTFHAYQRARRMGSALAVVRKGTNMAKAQFQHGFESSSGFRDAFAQLFGTTPAKSHDVKTMSSKWIETPLGPMLSIADDRGLWILDFVDRRGLEKAVTKLRQKEKCVILPGDHKYLTQIENELQIYFAGKLRQFLTPLAETGTPFQQSVWSQLLKIPLGETRSYLQLANSVGNSNAVRAVARANGDNYRSLIIPCHRVIGSDGQLTGYGGGLPRKQWLIDHERS